MTKMVMIKRGKKRKKGGGKEREGKLRIKENFEKLKQYLKF